ADFEEIYTIARVNVREGPPERIDRVRDVAELVVGIRIELAVTVIEHAAGMQRTAIAADNAGLALARVIVPNPAFERLFCALEDARGGGQVGVVKPMIDLGFCIIAVGSGARGPAPIISIPSVDVIIPRGHAQGHDGWRFIERNPKRARLVEFHSVPAAV